MGLILKSFTSPRSWYICSRQLSILKHKTLMIASSAVQKIWLSQVWHISHLDYASIIHCVHCHWYTNFCGISILCIFHLADPHLVSFPLPHIEDRLPQSFYCLLWEVVLHKPHKHKHKQQTQKRGNRGREKRRKTEQWNVRLLPRWTPTARRRRRVFWGHLWFAGRACTAGDRAPS